MYLNEKVRTQLDAQVDLRIGLASELYLNHAVTKFLGQLKY